MQRLKVLTFNVGGWRWSKWGFLNVRPVPFVDERMAYIPDALKASGADIILLQEVCERGHRELIKHKLSDIYPHAWESVPDNPRYPEGLLTLSRWPLGLQTSLLFPKADLAERFFLRKGALFTSVKLDSGKRVGIANTHLVSGGIGSPTAFWRESIRSDQARTLLWGMEKEGGGLFILGGDLNAGPEASPANYLQFLHKGHYIDACNSVPPGINITWDPKNPLNQNGPHKKCPEQRCDHIIVSRGINPVSSKVVFTEDVVPVGMGERVPLSDHNGVMATLEC